jgi:hypothetical protein
MRLRCVSAARHEADLTRSAGECFQEHVHFFEGETTLERHGLLAADLPGCTFGQLVNERCARAALAPNESVQQPRALLVVRTDGRGRAVRVTSRQPVLTRVLTSGSVGHKQSGPQATAGSREGEPTCRRSV